MLTGWLPILFAILLSEIRRSGYRRSIQTLTTIPNFISWVLIFSMAFALFANDGMVNNLLMNLGLIETRIQFLQSSNNVWLTMTAWHIWQSLGWGAIIYLAAIMGIDPALYEAARVDGAGRFRLIWHITVPGVLPTYTVLLLLGVANFLNTGFDQFFVFSNAFNIHRIQVLDLYVYNVGIMGGLLSLGTAISMLRSVVSLVLLLSVNRIAKWIRGESII
jgi:multiple sugar transport system permease protein/putative aldouronate transport system permease protein